MADDSDKQTKPPPPEDDGWGELASDPPPEAPAAAEADTSADDEKANEWAAPVHLDERVAALEDGSDLPAHPEPAAQAALSPDQNLAPFATETEWTGGDDGMAQQVAPPASPELISEQPEPVTLDFQATATVVIDEDAPQWSRDDIELPAPSSDMLAAAGVLAEKEDPKAEKRRKKRELGPKTQLTRRQQFVMIGGAVAVAGVGITALLGWFNSQHYYFVCDTNGIRAEQGRFWPWGQSPLSGEAFREIRIPSDALCTSREYESRAALEDAFLSALLTQSTALLGGGESDQVSEAERQLDQALLLSRDPERSTERDLAKRLQGDVLYWHGAAEIQKAILSLKEAAAQFDKAAAKRPRHSSDANPWAGHARYLQEELDKGPKSLRKDESPKDEPHFQGLSDPKPDKRPTTSGDSNADVQVELDRPDPIDAGFPTPDASPRPDAGLPKGGVLM